MAQATIVKAPSSTFSSSSSKAGVTAWGRYNDAGRNWGVVLGVILLLFFCPFLVTLALVSCRAQGCSLTATLGSLLFEPRQLWRYYWAEAGRPGELLYCAKMLAAWLAFQLALCLALPVRRPSFGNKTPSGELLKYYCNGFQAYVLSVALFLLGSQQAWWSMSIIYDHWPGLFLWANVVGYSLTLLAYTKARLFPSHPKDCKYSGSFIYDLFMGAELNPRLTDAFDWKLFWNGRPGIIGWTIINLSFLAGQMKQHGGIVSNSMILVNLLHALYVADFFWHEDWYLRTIDIAHDHFGFYLAWGDIVWLPFMYSLQTHYLAVHPHQLSWPVFCLLGAMGLAGYWIFRSANNQKDQFRKASSPDTAPLIWGRKPSYIPVQYVTVDPTSRETCLHRSALLTSGFWGLARHFNYLGDLLLSASMCLATGSTEHLLPYFYIIYMTILLVHRTQRDDQKCRDKYGVYWQAYTNTVPWKIAPYIY